MRKLTLCLALLAPAAAFAQAKDGDVLPEAPKKIEADTSRSYLRLAYNFYGQTDGGGNPDVNEDMQVHEPQVLLGVGLSEKLTLSVKMQFGVVSAASSNSGSSWAPAATTKKKTSTSRRVTQAESSGRQSMAEREGGDDDDGPVSGASGGGGGPVSGASGGGGPVSGASGGGGGGPVSGASGSGNGSTGSVSGASGSGSGGESSGSGRSSEPFLGIEPSLFYAWSDAVGVGAGLSYNQEKSYRSVGGNARLVLTTPDKNDTWSIRGAAAFDTMKVRYFDGSTHGNATRQTFGLGLGWTHILTPKTQVALNYDFTYQRGELATTSNYVLVAGTKVNELLPHTRMRHAFFGRIRQKILTDFAVEPGVGFYIDDWGAVASSFELHGSWEFVPGVLILQPTYRFHWQRQVNQFTSKSESSIPAYRTQDSDLGNFTSHTVGLKLVAPKVNIFGVDTEFEIGGDYTFRSDRLNAFTLTAGFLVRF
ncbi:MAG: porin family protein [Planctomycetes bacterium]|nr:porin family protein [Planctomycetota bacterium]